VCCHDPEKETAVETNVDEENFTVSIKGDGVAIEKNVPAHVAQQMITSS
jgi:hypothetical protein